MSLTKYRKNRENRQGNRLNNWRKTRKQRMILNQLFTAESVTRFGRSVQSKRSHSSQGFEFAKDVRTLIVTTFKEHSMQGNSH